MTRCSSPGLSQRLHSMEPTSFVVVDFRQRTMAVGADFAHLRFIPSLCRLFYLAPGVWFLPGEGRIRNTLPIFFEINPRVINGHPIVNQGCPLHPQ
jgi:hypothetical protein